MTGKKQPSVKSGDAKLAYKEGKLPKSGITKKHLVDNGIKDSLINVKRAIKDGHITPCDWYYTGGDWYNETEFFDLSEVKKQIVKLGGLKQYYQTKSVTCRKNGRVKGSYPIWGGSKKNPKRIGEREFTGTLRSNGWIYLDQGGRKKSNGNWIFWERI